MQMHVCGADPYFSDRNGSASLFKWPLLLDLMHLVPSGDSFLSFCSQVASASLGIGPAQAMSIAERLYTQVGGHVGLVSCVMRDEADDGISNRNEERVILTHWTGIDERKSGGSKEETCTTSWIWI